MRLKGWIRLIRETYAEWKKDNVPLHATALAYYTIFSLAPLLLIAIAVAGAAFGEEAARGGLVRQIQELVGKEGAAELLQVGLIEQVEEGGIRGSALVLQPQRLVEPFPVPAGKALQIP